MVISFQANCKHIRVQYILSLYLSGLFVYRFLCKMKQIISICVTPEITKKDEISKIFHRQKENLPLSTESNSCIHLLTYLEIQEQFSKKVFEDFVSH